MSKIRGSATCTSRLNTLTATRAHMTKFLFTSLTAHSGIITNNSLFSFWHFWSALLHLSAYSYLINKAASDKFQDTKSCYGTSLDVNRNVSCLLGLKTYYSSCWTLKNHLAHRASQYSINKGRKMTSVICQKYLPFSLEQAKRQHPRSFISILTGLQSRTTWH